MPENQHNSLTTREFIDLIKFLSELGKPGDYAVNQRPVVLQYKVLNNSQAWTRFSRTAGGKIEATLSRLPESFWKKRIAFVSGKLPRSEAVINAHRPIVLRADIMVTIGGPLAVKVEPTENVRVFFGEQPVLPNGDQTAELAAGHHTVFIVVDGEPTLDGLTVELVRPPQAATQFTIEANP